jgi:hypothetical protein
MLYTVYRLQYIFRANRHRKQHPENIQSMALAKALAAAEVEQEDRRISTLQRRMHGGAEVGDEFKRMSDKSQVLDTTAMPTPSAAIRRMSRVTSLVPINEDAADMHGGAEEASAGGGNRGQLRRPSLAETTFGDDDWDADTMMAKARGSLAFFLEHGHYDRDAPDVVLSHEGKPTLRLESAGKTVITAVVEQEKAAKEANISLSSGAPRLQLDGFGFTSENIATSAANTGPARKAGGTMSAAQHNWRKAVDKVSTVKAFLTGGYMDI